MISPFRNLPLVAAMALMPAALAQSGSINATPNPCSISSGQTLCTSAITWSSQGTSEVKIFVSQNGGTPVLFASSGAGGPYTQNASWIQASNTYVFTLYDYTSGSQGANLGSVNVAGVPTTIACGETNVAGDPAFPGNNITLSVSAPGATSLYFAVTGATSNPYSGQAVATLIGGSTWAATVNTSSLLGGYKVVPVASNGSGSATCTDATEFFNVRLSSPANPGQVPCASMTGTWADAASGQPTLTWTLNQMANQTITGTLTGPSECGQRLTWNAIGSYSGPDYNIYGLGGSPASVSCNGSTWTTLNQHIVGSLRGGGACGLGGGTWQASDPASGTLIYSGSNTMTAQERIPTGEHTTFSSWADSYGGPTTAIFDVALTGSQDVNFGGRRVTETIPAGASGTDGCYWPDAPWPAPFTSLATQDTWYVQTDSANGSYGRDYVGLNTNIVGFIQTFSPAVHNTGASCTIQYPQKMVINRETGIGTVPYGGQQSGYNQIVFTVDENVISVARGDASQARVFHF